jgi:peptidoglycan hydrolase-like protein with peptidoglycan-binding domain
LAIYVHMVTSGAGDRRGSRRPARAAAEVAMVQSGVAKVDQLVADPGAEPIAAGEADAAAVGVVQDLLLGHGFTQLPGVLGAGRGVFGPKTSAAATSFQQAQGLAATGAVDGPTLAALIAVPATRPIASLGYLTLVLQVAFLGMTRLMSLTSQFEGAGRFTARNRNSDRAGLSFGLIQWAQRPGRLTELLTAFQQHQGAAFAAVFGDGDGGLAGLSGAQPGASGLRRVDGSSIAVTFSLARALAPSLPISGSFP